MCIATCLTLKKQKKQATHGFGSDPGHVDVDGEVVGVDLPHRLPAPRGRAVAGVRRHRFLVPGQHNPNAFKLSFFMCTLICIKGTSGWQKIII